MPLDIPPLVAIVPLVALVALAAFAVSVAVGLLIGRSGIGDHDDRQPVGSGTPDQRPEG